jgi:hypothetical protein
MLAFAAALATMLAILLGLLFLQARRAANGAIAPPRSLAQRTIFAANLVGKYMNLVPHTTTTMLLSTVVGTSTTTCRPTQQARWMARITTSVLPQPTTQGA